jgi:hypothetical protein
MQRLTVVRFASLVLLLTLAPALIAQAPANWDSVKQIIPGREMRVSLSDGRNLRGEFQSASDDMLTIETSKSQEMLNRTMVRKVSVQGKSHRSRNALIGMGAGAAAGLIAGTLADRCTSQGIIGPFNGTLCLGPRSAGKEVLTPLGALVGVIAGALIPTRGWREVYLAK